MKERPKKVKPILRWAGGKQWISQRLAPLVPSNTRTYFEPFLGGGSLYFTVLPERAVLSDANQRLIETYQGLKDTPLEVIKILERWNNDEQTYYRVRQMNYNDAMHRVAQFIYLNRTCWNGLYRVNQKGKFNVPYGHHRREIFNTQHLLDISEILRTAELHHADFDQVLSRGQAGDFVYLDPPYTSLHQSNGFRQYNESLFNWRDQQRLGCTAVSLAERGCSVLVSNADHESVLKLYPGFSSQRVERHSILAASSKFRRVTSELLISSDPNLLKHFSKEVK